MDEVVLAVANRKETFERMAPPLAARGIECRHVPVTERSVPLTEDDPEREPRSPRDDDPPWPVVDAGFVYPGRPMEGGVADALLDVPWLNGRDAVLTSRNKAAVIARLARADVPVPDSVLVSNPVERGELRSVFERFDPPVVVKPNSTTRGTGVTKAHDLDSFLGICDYLGLVHDYQATGDKSFLVQEYLPDATDYRVMVLDGECVGAVERRIPAPEREAGQWKHNVHRGAEARGIELSEELRELAESVATTLGIRFLGVDILISDGHPVVSETNARPTIDDATKYDSEFYDRLAGSIRAVATE